MTQVFAPFVEAGVLTSLDVHLAKALGRLGNETRPAVLLAAALTRRATRIRSVCMDLTQVREQVQALADNPSDPVDLPWPADWSGLDNSPLVGDAASARPLVRVENRLYLHRYYQYEQRLVAAIRARVAHPTNMAPSVLNPILDRFFPPSGSELDRARLAAAMAALTRFTVISGGPGTGKTTAIRRILGCLMVLARTAPRPKPLRIALAAPTGKAAARMKEALVEGLPDLDLPQAERDDLAQLDTYTLHRLLGVRADNPSRFVHHADHPIPVDVVVVDEASMVDLALMSKLVDAVPPAARLILLGDRNQLASVEAGSVLGDVCGPGGDVVRLSAAARARFAPLVPHLEAQSAPGPGVWDGLVHLNRFWRFGNDSGIGGVARAIQRGGSQGIDDVMAYLTHQRTEVPGAPAYTDVHWAELAPDGSLGAEQRTAMVLGYRPYVDAVLGGASPSDCLRAFRRLRVLAAHRRGPLGVVALNALIEDLLHARVADLNTNDVYYLGRPLLITRNDPGLRLFNGDVGVVVRHPDDPHRRVVAVEGDTGPRLFPTGRLPEHETVWAMTIHKSQGSQFERVMVLLPGQPSPIVTRELVYTAVTRAQQQVTVVGRESVLRQALATRVQRASGLGDALWVPE